MIIEIEQNDIVIFCTAKKVQTVPGNGGISVDIDGTKFFSVSKGGTVTVRTDHGKTMRVLGLEPARLRRKSMTLAELAKTSLDIIKAVKAGDRVRVLRGEVLEVHEVIPAGSDHLIGGIMATTGISITPLEITHINNEPV